MITFSEVSKFYGKKKAVNRLSFEVSQGEILALLGPNGAGKSTSMKMLTGYLPTSEGKISVCGSDPFDPAGSVQSRVGYLPEGTPLYTETTVIEFLRFAAEAREVPAKQQKAAVDLAISRCGLEEVRYQLIDTLSKGYRQRTCFAQCLIHGPDVLVMDEPTDGLDPNQKKDLQEMIREMGQEKAIILSTHIMEEAEFMSDRILLLKHGESVAEGTMQELREQLGDRRRYLFRIADKNASQAGDALAALSGVSKVESVSARTAGSDGGFIVWESDESAQEGNLLSRLIELSQKKEWIIREVKSLESGLKDLFHEATGNHKTPEK